MYESLVELILQSEKSDFRFESYCISAVGKHEGVTYLPTSQSWDMGRDARSTGRGKGSHANVLCATLNDGLDAKAEADILRLTALASPDRIVYCSSQKLSEQRVDQITASLRRHAPNGSIVIYGAKQLAALADKDREIFEHSYGAELQEVRSMVYSDHPSGDPGSGLRLALLTFGSSEGTDLRDEALRSILLDRLSLQTVQTVEAISKPFSEDIGLQRTLPESYLIDALDRAKESGDVETLNGGWKLTVQGAEKQAALPLKGVEQILEGRNIVRAGIEKLIGKTFSTTQYTTIWSSLIDSISGMFHANGLEIIRGVDEILSGTSSTTKPLNLKNELENGMRSVVSSLPIRLTHTPTRYRFGVYSDWP